MADIKYLPGIPALSAYWTQYIIAALDKYGIPSITVSSTYRNPLQQATAMYSNVISYGLANQRKLYVSQGQKVLDVFEKYAAAKKPKADTLNAMAAKINELKWYSAHGSTNPDYIAIDIPPGTVPAGLKTNFENCMKAISSKFLIPGIQPGEPVYHIEFKKGIFGTAAKTAAAAGSTGAALIVAGLIFFLIYQKSK